MNQKNSPFNKQPLPEKHNPLVSMDNINPRQTEYKSVRIRPSDFEYLRSYAFMNDTTILEAVTRSVEFLKEMDADTLELVRELKASKAKRDKINS